MAQAHVAPLQAPVVSKSSQPRWGGADICPRCGKAVYMAEKMMGGGSVIHIYFFVFYFYALNILYKIICLNIMFQTSEIFSGIPLKYFIKSIRISILYFILYYFFLM